MIRPLTPQDVDAFIHIRKEMLSKEILSFGADPDRKIDRDQTIRDFEAKNEENFILGYFDNDELAGVVGCIRNHRRKEHHKAMIWGMYVYPRFRGRHVGKKLVQEAVDRISQVAGVEKIMLSVTSAAIPAKGLYESIGFRAYGHERDAVRWEGEMVDEYYMEYLVRR